MPARWWRQTIWCLVPWWPSSCRHFWLIQWILPFVFLGGKFIANALEQNLEFHWSLKTMANILYLPTLVPSICKSAGNANRCCLPLGVASFSASRQVLFQPSLPSLAFPVYQTSHWFHHPVTACSYFAGVLTMTIQFSQLCIVVRMQRRLPYFTFSDEAAVWFAVPSLRLCRMFILHQLPNSVAWWRPQPIAQRRALFAPVPVAVSQPPRQTIVSKFWTPTTGRGKHRYHKRYI